MSTVNIFNITETETEIFTIAEQGPEGPTGSPGVGIPVGQVGLYYGTGSAVVTADSIPAAVGVAGTTIKILGQVGSVCDPDIGVGFDGSQILLVGGQGGEGSTEEGVGIGGTGGDFIIRPGLGGAGASATVGQDGSVKIQDATSTTRVQVADAGTTITGPLTLNPGNITAGNALTIQQGATQSAPLVSILGPAFQCWFVMDTTGHTVLSTVNGVSPDPTWRLWVASSAGHAAKLNGILAYANLTTTVPMSVMGFANQSANLLEFNSSAPALLAAFDKNAGFKPAHMADSAAGNDTVYYSTTANKLVYKDSGGVVNALY